MMKRVRIPPPPLVIVLASELVIDAPYTGGEYLLKYSIENAESRRPYIDANADWIEIRSKDNTSSSVHIAASDGTLRSGEILLSYPSAETVRISVVQQARSSFAERVSLEIKNVTMGSADVVLRNANEDAWACPLLQTKSYYDQYIAPDPKAWVETYVPQMYKQWRTYCSTSGKSVLFEDYWGITNKDEASKTFPNLQIESPYVAIGLEIDPEGNYSGEIIIKEFTSAPLPPVETIDLSFSVTLAYNASAPRDPYTIIYVPSDKTVQYFAEVYTAADLDSNIGRLGGLKEWVADYLSTYFQYASKYTGDGVFRGDVWIEPLPETLQVSVVLCGCDKYGRITSQVVRKDCTVNLTESSTQTL